MKPTAIHSAHFFEMADEPFGIQLANTEEESDSLFQKLEYEPISLFYIKTPIEIGFVGGGDASDQPTPAVDV